MMSLARATSMKALDPDGRLEKRKSTRDLAMSHKCLSTALWNSHDSNRDANGRSFYRFSVLPRFHTANDKRRRSHCTRFLFDHLVGRGPAKLAGPGRCAPLGAPCLLRLLGLPPRIMRLRRRSTPPGRGQSLRENRLERNAVSLEEFPVFRVLIFLE